MNLNAKNKKNNNKNIKIDQNIENHKKNKRTSKGLFLTYFNYMHPRLI